MQRHTWLSPVTHGYSSVACRCPSAPEGFNYSKNTSDAVRYASGYGNLKITSSCVTCRSSISSV